jgi:anti-sigma regulatory factor (Ser/Thr protein kinase)
MGALPAAELGGHRLPDRPPGDWPEALPSLALFRGDRYHVAEGQRALRTAWSLVCVTLWDWGLGARPNDEDLVHDVRYCCFELVTNALKHAEPRGAGWVSAGLRLWARGQLFLEVGDGDPGLPRLRTDDAPESGRGLQIVAGLADAWWPRRTGDGGKKVYARFDLARYGLGRCCDGPAGCRRAGDGQPG